jgi:hypothetical protein
MLFRGKKNEEQEEKETVENDEAKQEVNSESEKDCS